MLTPSTAAMKPSGKLGATPLLSRSPSASKNRIAHKEPPNSSSTSRHNASRIAASELSPVINSRIFFSAPRTASAHLRSSMSVFVPYHLTIFPVSSNSGSARNKNQRYTPSKRRSRASNSPGSPEASSLCHTSSSRERSSRRTATSHPQSRAASSERPV